MEIFFLSPISVHKWKRHRRIISPVFNTNLVDHFFPVFNDKTEILIENLKKEVGKTKTFDLLDYMAPTTLDIICREYSIPVHKLRPFQMLGYLILIRA